MRDLQHWKDKVELSLDGRQVFFLFFGGAVLACLLFAVGVMTGRRLEARAIALETPATDDPLAALDQLGDLEDDELTYHRALTKDTNRPARPMKDTSAPAIKPVAAPAKPVPAPAAVKPAVAMAKPATAAINPVRVVPPAAVVDAELVAEAPKPGKPIATPVKGETKERGEPGQAHFTLQLSAFSARKDADDLMHRVQAAGYKPFVVSSDVPGKGVVFRVRIGDYVSKDAAIAEKNAVESKLKVAAYLAKL